MSPHVELEVCGDAADAQPRDMDPRHGTVAGYNRIPCRQDCCRDAMARYRRGREWDVISGRPRIVDATGSRRRLEALMALGWSRAVVGETAGLSASNMTRLRRADTITSATANAIRHVYDQLSMRVPPTSQPAANVRNYARRHGFVPPLAWDDETIDDPAARPRGQARAPKMETVDPIAVERVLAGERLPTTLAEKREITRRWTARGGSLNELERVTGWNALRYVQEAS